MKMAMALVIALVLGAMAYIRFSGVDVARWHVAPDLRGAGGVQSMPGGAFAVIAGAGAAELARLDGIAMATPRTRRLAGSVETGMITWETRSAFWGFPDYTTAAIGTEPDGLHLIARLRFGSDDFGVNAARLTEWLRLLRVASGPQDVISG